MYKKGDYILSFLKSSCYALLFMSLCSFDVLATGSASIDSEESTQNFDEKIVDSPSYNDLLPVPGWNRYSGDTASSIKEWKRWWNYLLLEKSSSGETNTVIMKWIKDLYLRIYPGNEVFRSIFVKGIYDPNLVVVVDALLPAKGVLVDIGANMGYCSLLMSRSVGDSGKIFAIEPSERDFLRLVDNVALNKLDNVYVYRFAISNEIGDVEISIATEERSFLNTLGFEFSNKGIEKLKTEKVEAITLDKFVEKEDIDRIDVIKMDIEGSELKALTGARKSIEMYRPALVLGINKNSLKANEASVEEVEKVLKELRYKMYYLTETPIFALKEVTNVKEVKVSWIVCLHESFVPPILPQPKKKGLWNKVGNFFTK